MERSSNIKDKLLQECIQILNRPDIKNEIKNIFKPFINEILNELYPYIYLSLIFVSIAFLLILGIFYLLMRNKIKVIHD